MVGVRSKIRVNGKIRRLDDVILNFLAKFSDVVISVIVLVAILLFENTLRATY